MAGIMRRSTSGEGPDEGKKTHTASRPRQYHGRAPCSQLDFSWLLLDYLSFGAYGDAHYGRKAANSILPQHAGLSNGSNRSAVNLAPRLLI